METTDAATEDVQIAVPRAYQDYLVAGMDKRYAFGIAVLVALTFAFKRVPDSVAVVSAFVGAFLWYFQRRKRWHYSISRREITVIWTQMYGRYWDWHTVRWKRQLVLGVEETEWRGLPALRLLGQAKTPRHRPDWLLVYAHEDTERVRNQVLPLIERYRKQCRQDSLAERLRSPEGTKNDVDA